MQKQTFAGTAGRVVESGAGAEIQSRLRVVEGCMRVFDTVAGFNGSDVAELRRRLKSFLESESVAQALAEYRSDWDSCKCKLHRVMPCNVPSAEGCAGKAFGSFGPIASMYTGRHFACTVGDGPGGSNPRVVDRQILGYVELGMPVRGGLKHFYTSVVMPVERLGAWYCYSELFAETVRLRIARLLGPDGSAKRLLLYYIMLGLRVVHGVELVVLKSGNLHVERVEGRKVVFKEVVEFLLRGAMAGATVGAVEPVVMRLSDDRGLWMDPADHETFAQFSNFAETLGVQLPLESASDVALAFHSAAVLAKDPNDVLRLRRYEMLGDAIVRMFGICVGIQRDEAVPAIRAKESHLPFKDAIMERFETLGFKSRVKVMDDAQPMGFGVVLCATKSLVAIVYSWCGQAAGIALAERFGLVR